MAKLFTPKVNAESFNTVKQMLAGKKTYKQIAQKTGLSLSTIQAINQTTSLEHYRERLSSREKLRKAQRRVEAAQKGSIAMVQKAEQTIRDQERQKRAAILQNRAEILQELYQEQDDNTKLARWIFITVAWAVLATLAAIVIFVVK